MMANYERILRIVILLDGVLGLLLLLWPALLAGSAHGYGPEASTWARGNGLLLVLLSLALLPAAFVARANRYLAVFAVAAQAMMGLFFLLAGHAWLIVIYFLASTYLLGTAFWRGFRQDLMSRP